MSTARAPWRNTDSSLPTREQHLVFPPASPKRKVKDWLLEAVALLGFAVGIVAICALAAEVAVRGLTVAGYAMLGWLGVTL